jgi:hypothetical protein
LNRKIAREFTAILLSFNESPVRFSNPGLAYFTFDNQRFNDFVNVSRGKFVDTLNVVDEHRHIHTSFNGKGWINQFKAGHFDLSIFHSLHGLPSTHPATLFCMNK